MHPHHVALKALLLGVLSGLSLPIGVLLGIWLEPIDDRVCGGIMAFGAGALLFAVTVAIFGHTIAELEEEGAEIYTAWMGIVGGVLGSLFFINVSRWLDDEAPEAEVLLRETEPLVRKSSKDRTYVRKKSLSLAEVALELNYTPSAMVPIKRQDTPPDTPGGEAKGLRVAYAVFAGLLIDGIPEGVFMGALAAEDHLSAALVASLFVANFPEAFTAAALLRRGGLSVSYIMAMWGGLCLLIGAICGVSCYGILCVFPAYFEGEPLPKGVDRGVSLIEGFTGGAMLACIASIMLPDAQERAGRNGSMMTSAGFLSTVGFLSSVALEVMFPSW